MSKTKELKKRGAKRESSRQFRAIERLSFQRAQVPPTLVHTLL